MALLIKIHLKSIIRDIRKGNTQKALEKLNAMKNDKYEVPYYKGICYFDMNNFDEAQICLEKAYNYQKDDMEIAILLAQAYLLQKNSKKSLEVLKQYKDQPEAKYFIKIIMNGKESINTYVEKTKLIGKAMNNIRNNNYEKSIQLFNIALEYIGNKEEKAKIYNLIGGVYCNYIKDIEQAKEYFQRATKLSPQVKEYKRNLMRVQNI